MSSYHNDNRVGAVVKIDGTTNRVPLSERGLVDRLTQFLVQHQDRESLDQWDALHKVALHMETDESKRKSLQKLQPARGRLPQGDNYADADDEDDFDTSNNNTNDQPKTSTSEQVPQSSSTTPLETTSPSHHPQQSTTSTTTSSSPLDESGLSKEERKKRKRERKEAKKLKKSAKKAKKDQQRMSEE